MKTIKIYLPYSSKAMIFLRTISKRYGATWVVDENEIVTIQASTEKKIEKIKIFSKKCLTNQVKCDIINTVREGRQTEEGAPTRASKTFPIKTLPPQGVSVCGI